MEFCEFIEYNMRNIFLEESYRKEDVMEKLVPDPFLEIKIEHSSGLIV